MLWFIHLYSPLNCKLWKSLKKAPKQHFTLSTPSTGAYVISSFYVFNENFQQLKTKKPTGLVSCFTYDVKKSEHFLQKHNLSSNRRS